MSSHAATHHDHYFVPSPSPLPFALTASLTLFVIGLIQMIEYGQSMPVLFFVGVGLSLICIYAWFWKIVTEAEGGKYNAQVDMTYRWGCLLYTSPSPRD